MRGTCTIWCFFFFRKKNQELWSCAGSWTLVDATPSIGAVDGWPKTSTLCPGDSIFVWLNLFFKGRRCIFWFSGWIFCFESQWVSQFPRVIQGTCEAHVMLKHDMFSVTVWPCFDQCKPNSLKRAGFMSNKNNVASSIFTPYAYLVLAQNIAKNIDQNLEHVEHM